MWRGHSCLPCRDSSRHVFAFPIKCRRQASAWVPTRQAGVPAPRHGRAPVRRSGWPGWRRSVPRIGDSAAIGPDSNPRHDDKREEDASRLSRTGRTWDKRPGAGFGPAGVFICSKVNAAQRWVAASALATALRDRHVLHLDRLRRNPDNLPQQHVELLSAVHLLRCRQNFRGAHSFVQVSICDFS